jgi:hypothetical protein
MKKIICFVLLMATIGSAGQLSVGGVNLTPAQQTAFNQYLNEVANDSLYPKIIQISEPCYFSTAELKQKCDELSALKASQKAGNINIDAEEYIVMTVRFFSSESPFEFVFEEKNYDGAYLLSFKDRYIRPFFLEIYTGYKTVSRTEIVINERPYNNYYLIYSHGADVFTLIKFQLK